MTLVVTLDLSAGTDREREIGRPSLVAVMQDLIQGLIVSSGRWCDPCGGINLKSRDRSEKDGDFDTIPTAVLRRLGGAPANERVWSGHIFADQGR